LPHGLTGVDHVGHAQLGAHLTDGTRILHQPGIGRHPRERDEPGAGIACQAADALRVDAALGEIVGAHGLDAGAPRQRQVHQLVRRIVGARGDDTVAGTEVERGERLGERDGGVLDQRDVSGRRADQLRHQGVGLPHQGLRFVGRLVAADRRLPREVIGERVEHGAGHEPGAGVVQMNALPAPGRVAAPAVELDGGGGQRGRDHR